jgi:hypothetical protein
MGGNGNKKEREENCQKKKGICNNSLVFIHQVFVQVNIDMLVLMLPFQLKLICDN